jgi:heme-degrading monooxygenase HmoA
MLPSTTLLAGLALTMQSSSQRFNGSTPKNNTLVTKRTQGSQSGIADQFSFSRMTVRLSFLQSEEATMIARIWHGYTKPEHADAYEAMLKPELLPGISKVKGYKASYLLRKAQDNEVEFITIMLWDSIDAIRAFAGPDYETSVVPEERRKYLSRHDAKSVHYEIASIHGI